MAIEINIPEESLECFSKEAIDELKLSSLKYTLNIIDEANRIDATIRSKDDKPEITRAILKNAVLFNSNPFKTNKKSWKFTILQVISSLFLFFSGLLYDFKRFSQDKNHLITFLAITGVAIISTTYMHFIGREEK